MHEKLSTKDHSRDIVGLKYIYPVISRRAGGLSIGVNFNSNNACNWRCVYCQVPDLVRGAAPELDFQRLEWELRFFLDKVLHGDFFDQFDVSHEHRVIKDIAISGNGEPTSLNGFAEAVRLIGQIASEKGVLPNSHFVLITNGSLLHQKSVQDGLKVFDQLGGQVWFKLDSASNAGRRAINDNKQSNQQVLENLRICTSICETLLQTCVLSYLSDEERETEKQAYIDFLKLLKQKQYRLKKILLYTVARPSMQAEAENIQKIAESEMTSFADKIAAMGFDVTASL